MRIPSWAVKRPPPPAVFSIPSFAFALVLLWAGTGRAYIFIAAVMVAHALVYLWPWRVPRTDRTRFSYWLEALVCAAPIIIGSVAWLVMYPQGVVAATALITPSAGWMAIWLVVACGVGAFMVWLSRVNLGALRSGDLAFLAGPLEPYRAAARTWTVAISVVCEDVIFRGVPASVPSYRLVAMTFGALAFIAGHHMVRGTGQPRWALIRLESTAAILFGLLVVASGSVWPAVLAHTIADTPHVSLDIQRARSRSDELDETDEAMT